jgi:GntR family transcriptional regulator
LIAQGRYPVGRVLPSTRLLARQLDVSFHTVRRAYGELVERGLVNSIPGRGFEVAPPLREGKSARMEEGATIIGDAIKKLVGLGLDDSDMEYLFEEQLSSLTAVEATPKIVFAAAYAEQGAECARQLRELRVRHVEPTIIANLNRYEDAEYAIAPFAVLRTVMSALPRTDCIGVTTILNEEALDRIARMMSHETITLIAFHPETIRYISADVRQQTGFPGQIMAASVSEGTSHAVQLIRQADLVAYTPAARRRISEQLRKVSALEVSSRLTDDSLDAVLRGLPDVAKGS